MPKMTGGKAVVEALKQAGVEIVFGLPGVQIMGIFDAFFGEPDVKLITVRHEQTAVYMADGYARVKGKPGVALVVPGPGVQNASAALGTAYACSSPVLLIAGQVESYHLGQDRGALHEINDQLDIVRPVTKWCQRVMRVRDIPQAIQEAMRQMNTGRPRPTEIEIPWDVVGKEEEVSFPRKEEFSRKSPPLEDIKKAARLLLEAKKPLIWGGGGVILANASRELKELAEILKAPVATTPEGKGAFPESHALSLGGGYYGFGSVRYLSSAADVILAIGTRLTGQMRPGTAPKENQKLIHIDADANLFNKNFPAEVAIAADAKEALRILIEELGQGKFVSKSSWTEEEMQAAKNKHRQWLKRKAPLQTEIIETIRNKVPQETILISGVTNIGYWCNLAYPVELPRTYFTSSYFATLGYAFPTGLGAKVAAPDKPVIAVVGDGGFMYAMPDLATAVKYGINLITLVFNDQAFGSTKCDQQINFQGRIIGTDLQNPDFTEVAKLFGAKGIKTSPEKLGRVLEEALSADRPVVIEIPVTTMIAPFQISPLED